VTGVHRAAERGSFLDMARYLSYLADTGMVRPGTSAERWGALFARLTSALAEGAPLPVSLVCSPQWGAQAHLATLADLDRWAIGLDASVSVSALGSDEFREFVTELRGVPLRMWTRAVREEPGPPPKQTRWSRLWRCLSRRIHFGRSTEAV
jgi:hypothetical protein